MTDARRLFVVIGVDSFRELLAWVIAANAAEQREQRREFARKALAMALDAVDHDQMNAQIRSALRPDPFATPKTSADWRN